MARNYLASNSVEGKTWTWVLPSGKVFNDDAQPGPSIGCNIFC